MPMENQTSQGRGHRTKKKMQQDHPKTKRRKQTTNHQNNKHRKSQKTEQGNFIDRYCNVREGREKTNQNKKKAYHIRKGNQNSKTNITIRRKKRNKTTPTNCTSKRGKPQHQTQQGDEAEPGRKSARRTPKAKKITHEPKHDKRNIKTLHQSKNK